LYEDDGLLNFVLCSMADMYLLPPCKRYDYPPGQRLSQCEDRGIKHVSNVCMYQPNYMKSARFEVSTVVLLRIQSFLDVSLCR
jgi:hypothetical protein